MATLLKTDGTTEEISGELTLKRMQELVGGYIEMVRIGPNGAVLIVDEEGRLKAKLLNFEATRLYRGEPARHHGIIVGDAIRCVVRNMGLESEVYE